LQPRPYQPSDAATIDTLLDGHGHVLLDRDRIVVLGEPGRPSNMLIWRPGAIVHGLYISHSLGQLQRANSLVQFGIESALSQPWPLYEATFLTDGDKMAEYVKSLGAVEETGKQVWTLRLR
jgi:hypothetical protein